MQKVRLSKFPLTITIVTGLSARGENIGPGAAGPQGPGQGPQPAGSSGSGPRQNQPATKTDSIGSQAQQPGTQPQAPGNNPIRNNFPGERAPG